MVTNTVVSTPTWTVEGVPNPVVVVPLVKSQPDVRRTFGDLAERQVGHVTPQLKGRLHHQPHGAQRQVARPVYNLVGQVMLVPLPVWGTRMPRAVTKLNELHVNKCTLTLVK